MITEMNASADPQWALDFEKEIQEKYGVPIVDSIFITGKVEQIVRIQKQEMIEKACKSFCDTLCPNECRLKGGTCPFENQFRESMKKSMEE